jgi:hypothetical protein
MGPTIRKNLPEPGSHYPKRVEASVIETREVREGNALASNQELSSSTVLSLPRQRLLR